MSEQAPGIERAAELDDADREMVSLLQRLKLGCPQCRYDLSANETPVCPECGTHVRKSDYRVRKGLPRSNALVVAIVGACQLLFAGPAATVALMSQLMLPGAVEGALVLLSVAVCGVVLWVVAYRPLDVLGLPGGMKMLVLGGLAIVGVVATLGMVIAPVWLVGDAMGWW